MDISQYAILFPQSLINPDIFLLPLWYGSDFQTFFDFKQHKYLYLIQKKIMDPLIFEVWTKNFLSFAAKMFFLQSRETTVSAYIGVRYKNLKTNVMLLNLALID